MSMRIVKTYTSKAEADHVWSWYQALDVRYVPRCIQREGGTALSYNFVDGAPCWKPRLAWETLKAAVWDTTRRDDLPVIDLRGYCQYVHDVWADWQESAKDNSVLAYHSRSTGMPDDYVDLLLEELLSLADQLTPVRQVHGDATLLNFVLDHRGRVTMIDPGHPRGLYVRELDESKILQSLMGYDRLCTGGATPEFNGPLDAPFKLRRVHQLLLATHCVRLLRHQARRERTDLVHWALDTIYGFCNSAL